MESNTTNQNSQNQNQNPRHGWRIFLIIVVVICAAIFGWIVMDGQKSTPTTTAPIVISPDPTPVQSPAANVDIPAATVMVTGMKIPWDFAFLPDKSMLVTERAGNLVYIQFDATTTGTATSTRTSIKLPHPVPKGEGGLLGIVLHPNFAQNKFLYLYMTTQNMASGTKNAVFRYRYEGGKLLDEKTIIENIPGALYHDGGRLAFGPDGYLYITTGDATTDYIAQDLKSLGGKILRLTDDGQIPADNPFGTAVYSYGHRNPQGLAWDGEGRLWETEHGRSGALSGMDEINLIEKGKNYGWPAIEGDATKTGMVTPVLNSGPNVTWAPASALYFGGHLFIGGLLGQSLYEAGFGGDNGDKIIELKSHFVKVYGRIRTVRVGPDGMLYFTTSNRDGRGKPVADDDRIVRVNPDKL